MNAELKSVLTTVQSQYLCLAPSWLLLLQSDIDGEDSHWPTLTFLHNIDNIHSPGRYRAARCGQTARTWSCLTAPGDGECLGRVVSSCHVCRGYLGGAGRGDLRYSEQAEQVGNLEMDHGNMRQEYLIDFFNKYCLFSKDLIHNCNQTGINF